ncbi:LysR family transcriptional regulator [Izhakiella australiensis]|uniref:LysR family transcriptional regulator n=1 Tax=Izhakiella australiensis TaxID=1926881 RepID=A0A1S8YJ45_9GAMM|nr:LysR family transcriptional regulator [Izhakiella australiensis]OON39084.1 LysR family transcriptional regulator [Izhakiella australiensis]
MDKVQQLQLYVRIVDGGSFFQAARDLGIARSTATNAIKQLELETGVQLLARTTRAVKATPEGEEFYRRARAVLGDIEDTWTVFRKAAPGGHLRINASGLMTRTFLVPRLPAFLQRYPDIVITFGQTDRFVNLVREGVDCVIRVGVPEDSSLRLRRLGTLQEITCASPTYLAKHGTPYSIDDLDGHKMVGFVSSQTGDVMPLEFVRDGRSEIRLLPAQVMTDNSDTAGALAAEGLGLIQAPRYRFEEQLQRGELVEVLAGYPPTPMQVNAIYAGERQASRRLDVFLNWVSEIFAEAL